MTNLLLLGFLPSGSEWVIIALLILLSLIHISEPTRPEPRVRRQRQMCIRDRW